MSAFAPPTTLPPRLGASAAAAPPAVSSHRRTPVMVAGKTIGETISTDPKYSVLAGLLSAAAIDVDAVSAASGGATVFAPTNSAFDSGKLSASISKLLAEDGKAVLLRHVIPGSPLTMADLKKRGNGFFENVPGGPLSFEAAGVANVRIGDVPIRADSPVDDVCDNGVVHTITDIIADKPLVQLIPTFTAPPPVMPRVTVDGAHTERARKAVKSVSTVGGRKAMGLLQQLPFYMYGPPYNAAKQEEFEPISIAFPEGAYVDYQLMPPGSVVVEPDEVSANKLNPVSGMSKYIGKTKRLVEGDAVSNYSHLDDLDS